ncbi:hypothetical protein HanIR_Chr10g0454471 [Helianthus annuus]|nr:hypothetical protein HanIR_Chr10g0454471 [Helianthus annuus]
MNHQGTLSHVNTKASSKDNISNNINVSDEVAFTITDHIIPSNKTTQKKRHIHDKPVRSQNARQSIDNGYSNKIIASEHMQTRQPTTNNKHDITIRKMSQLSLSSPSSTTKLPQTKRTNTTAINL